MLKISNTHTLEKKVSTGLGWQAAGLELTPITMPEAPRHRIRQDAAIPLAERKFQNLNVSIKIFAEICRSLNLSYISIN